MSLCFVVRRLWLNAVYTLYQKETATLANVIKIGSQNHVFHLNIVTNRYQVQTSAFTTTCPSVNFLLFTFAWIVFIQMLCSSWRYLKEIRLRSTSVSLVFLVRFLATIHPFGKCIRDKSASLSTLHQNRWTRYEPGTLTTHYWCCKQTLFSTEQYFFIEVQSKKCINKKIWDLIFQIRC